MPYVNAMRCKECLREYPVEPINVCEFCFGPLELVYDYDAIRKVVSRKSIEQGPFTMWRYKDLLPASGENPVDISAGFTPLVKAQNLGEELGLTNLYLKNDSVNPSFSFKDRVVSVAATKALEFEFDTLSCASTGNLACSVAAHAARAGMKAVVFIPADLEKGKVIGAAIYQPTLVAVNGNYDEVNRLCSEIADRYPWAFVNINMRPVLCRRQQDPCVRGSGAIGLAHTAPCHRSCRIRLHVHQDMARLQRDGGFGLGGWTRARQHAPDAGRGVQSHR